MAADKKSYLRDAQKLVQKGQIDRAITAYKAIIKLDPNDVKVHNSLGDLHLRSGKKKDAVGEYLWVANFYERDGFHLRSIAMCQKILNIDPEAVEVQLKLGDLYSQQKLLVEAKRQYLKVADFYEKKKKVAEALEVFSKIADMDPGNVQIRVKLAVNYEKQSLPSKAAGEFAAAAEGYIKAKEPKKALELLDRALKMSPDNPRVRFVLAELQATREEWEGVVKTLESVVGGEKAEVQALKTYAGACLKTGRAAEAIGALEKARQQEPSSLALKSLLGRAYMEGDRFESAFDLLSPLITDYLKDDKIDAAEDVARELVNGNPESDKAQQKLVEILQRKGESEEAAEVYRTLAGIYRAKDLTRNAVGALEKVLELKPGDPEAAAAIEELHGAAPAPAAAEPPVPAEPVLEEEPLAEAEEEMEVEMFDLEGEEFADLAAVAAEAEEAVEETEIEEAAAAPGEVTLEESLEEEIVIEPEEMEVAVEEAPPEGEFPSEAPPEVEPFAEAPAPEAIPEEAPAAAEGEEIDWSDLEETGEEPAAAGPVQEPAAEEPVAAAAPGSAEEIVEEVDLEGAELFSSEETEALMREGVLDAEPGAAEEPAPPEAAGVDIDLEALVEAGEPEGAVAEPFAEAAPAPSTEAGVSEEMEEFLAEADFYLQQGLLDEAEFLYKKLSKLDPGNPHITERLERLEQEKAGAAKAEAPGSEQSFLPQDEIAALESDLDRMLGEEPRPPAPAARSGLKVSVSGGPGQQEAGEFTDFLSELRQELEPGTPEPEAVVDSEESLSAIFEEFQEGIKDQLGEEDFETHYNLGIAYKEMGLMNEALGEFVLSEKSEARRLDSISMIALCLKGLGREQDALEKLREGLGQTEEGSDKQKGFLYDMADLMSQTGQEEDSKELFRRLSRLDPAYRDAAARAGGAPPAAPGPDEEEEAGGDEKPRDSKSRVSYL